MPGAYDAHGNEASLGFVAPLPMMLLCVAGQPAGYENLEVSLTRHTEERYVVDLEGIRRKGVLRVLTRNNSEDYFIASGLERGFQQELAATFAAELGVRVAFVVPRSREQLVDALIGGQGDLIAAGLTITRARGEKVLFTRPVLEAQRVIVTKVGLPKPIRTIDDLAGLTIHTSFRSTAHGDLAQLGARAKLELVDVTDGVEMEEMMRRVAEGLYPATVADSNLVELEVAGGLEIEGTVPIGPVHAKAWAVHPGAPALAEAADAFIGRSKKNGLVKIFYDRYYRTQSKWTKTAHDETIRADKSGAISPYDDLFKRAAAETGLDWRLLAAVGYTESRFDPKAKSAWGAVGVMQVLPSTAKGVGVSSGLEDPAANILAGARYLKRMIAPFEKDEIEMRQRIRFAVASYNAGLGHVLDARKIARDTGLDHNRWFKNVEKALMLKRDRKWHQKTAYGYCRADETTKYVSSVQSRYDVYVRYVPLD
jgi:membrane-bound lytic murein transglycosylase F